MDDDRQDLLSETTGQGHPSSTGPVPVPSPQPPRKKGLWRGLWGIVTFLSMAANIALAVLLVGVLALFATGGLRGGFQEEVLQPGPHTAKIVVIPIEGVIDADQARRVTGQLKAAREDQAVKGLILRIDSPGGSISGSDQIYHEVRRFREDQGKPVLAFLQGLAASGGYYTAVACDRILAEPTVITGSIGVILGHFVFGDLLEKKLGVQPVILKSGQKKDWPSSYTPPTEEQLQYLQERVIAPAYERFFSVVAEGRKDVLTPDQIRPLADGGVYTAPEARDKRLIDEIGYLDDAVRVVQSMAGLDKAQVVEYQQTFSWTSLLAAKSGLGIKLDRSSLLELGLPRAMYLWGGY
ncbi:MAG: signal peptide peptidase SppA [Phycisphaerae bacterium]|nr:signal peptide peptidase SppA [Phycisphaerae bacterium]